VAVGGRATLFGPALGAIAVAWAQTALSEGFPSFWTYFQGALFVLVIAFLPGGLSSLNLLRGSLWRRRVVRTGDPQAQPSDVASADRHPEPDLSGVIAGSEAGQ
jgi:urea transport system permease protein